MAATLSFDPDTVEALPQSCALCRSDTDEAEELRRLWGCDRELTATEWEASHAQGAALAFDPCYRCAGRDPDCSVCEGRNTWQLRRCPFATVEQWHYDVCSCVDLQRVGIQAVAGGWMDQPALVVHASRVVRAELGRINEAKEQRAQREHERRQRTGR